MDVLAPSQQTLFGPPVELQAASPNLAEEDSSVLLPVAVASQRELAPMLAHYVRVKEQYPDHLLLFQVGDFFEIFFEDAKIAAECLQIRLTSRDKDQTNPIPMCGVPVHAFDNYLPRLLKAGFSCVVVSQVEEAGIAAKGPAGKAPAGKVMVRREITRIVTPGVRFEGDGLEERSFNYLAAVCFGAGDSGAIAYIDVSTGRFRIEELEGFDSLVETVRRVRPSELIFPSVLFGARQGASESWVRKLRTEIQELSPRLVFRSFERVSRESLKEEFKKRLLSTQRDLTAGQHEADRLAARLQPFSLSATTTLFAYVDEVSFGQTPKLTDCRVEDARTAFVIDVATRRNLELLETRMDGERKNSLLGRIDYTRTAMGARLLQERLLSPSTNRQEIESRLDALQELLENYTLVEEFRELALGVRDLERLLSRVMSARATPRDLAQLRDSLLAFPAIENLLRALKVARFEQYRAEFDPLSDVADCLTQSLSDEPPLRSNEGEIFRDGYHPELDHLRSVRKDGRVWLEAFEARERTRTGIPSLKVKQTSVFGHFIEISKAQLSKTPDDYERRQTLVNAERFITPELKRYEQEVLSAQGRQVELERQLFIELRDWVQQHAHRIQSSAGVVSELDVLASLAHLAHNHGYVRPSIAADNSLKISGGRHPVIERVIGAHNFVPNDAQLRFPERRFAVLAGPNMGGKSTYLRQVGLIQLLFQAGSYVPAASAELSVVDRIFTRIGSSDDLARGDSTFMVEMREAATILKRATPQSLVLIDELGRGTATADGLALATAISECLLLQVRCRTIFATHFHELSEFAVTQDGAFSLAVGVIERDKDISFTHRIEEAVIDRSYGVHVARLAGVPESVLTRAEKLLTTLEVEKSPLSMESNFKEASTAVAKKQSPEQGVPEYWNIVMSELEQLEPNQLTPIQALQELVTLKSLMRQGG